MTNSDEGLTANAGDVSLDGKAFHRGRGLQITGFTLAIALLVGGAVYLLLPGDDEAFRAVGKQVNGLDQRNFDAFMGCAVGNRNLSKVKSNLDLQNQIFDRSIAGKRYGKHLREDCMPKLDEMTAKLEALIPPEPLQDDVVTLKASVEKLRSGWSGYIAHLEGLEEGFDREAEGAKEPLDQALEGWREYTIALSEINKQIREKIEG